MKGTHRKILKMRKLSLIKAEGLPWWQNNQCKQMPDKPVCRSTFQLISPKFQAFVSTANSKSLLGWLIGFLTSLPPVVHAQQLHPLGCSWQKPSSYSQLLSFPHPLCQGILFALLSKYIPNLSPIRRVTAVVLLWATCSCLLLLGPSAFSAWHSEWSFPNKSKLVYFFTQNYSWDFTQKERQSSYEGWESPWWFAPHMSPFHSPLLPWLHLACWFCLAKLVIYCFFFSCPFPVLLKRQ